MAATPDGGKLAIPHRCDTDTLTPLHARTAPRERRNAQGARAAGLRAYNQWQAPGACVRLTGQASFIQV